MSYITKANLESLYGEENIEAWARMTDTESSAVVDARIDDMIEVAEGEVEASFRKSNYSIPLSVSNTNSLALIKMICTKKAAYYLYTLRGLNDEENKLRIQTEDTDRLLNRIVTGQLRIDANRITFSSDVPTVV